MASGLIEKEIDGIKYEFEKWGAEEALDTLLKISKVAGKSLGIALSSLTTTEEGPNFLALAFDALTGNMDEKLCMSLVKKLTSEKVFCQGAKIQSFSVHYQDRLMHMFKVAQAALEVQYGNFFEELLGIVGVTRTAVSNRVQAT